MSPVRGCAPLTAQAYVMEQVAEYAVAVGGMRAIPYDSCITYEEGQHCVIVAYPPEYDPALPAPPPADEGIAALNTAVERALAHSRCTSVTVLAPDRPAVAPSDAAVHTDAYAFLPLPLPAPDAKLRNMLRRASRECVIASEPMGEEHETLLQHFCRSHALDEGTRSIYANIGQYLASSSAAVLFTARAVDNARLLALAVGEYASLTTAFYMFAARAASCPPGVADALLLAVIREAEKRGHSLINLGLGINEGVRRFKQKWGRARLLPYVETSWKRIPVRADATARPDAAAFAAMPDSSPLRVYKARPLADRLRRALFGDARPFDCVQVEVTSLCPGQCSYCPHTTRRDVWKNRHMSEETFAALHPIVRRARRVHLQGWGEPLLNPCFFSFASAARLAGCAVSTTTCGLHVTANIARKLVDCGLDIVAFSLTGVDEAGNAFRKGIPLSAVTAGIAALQEARRQAKSPVPHIHLAYLLLASQVEAVTGLPALMARLNVSTAVVSTLDYMAAPELQDEAFAPGDRRIGAALDVLRRAAAQAKADGRHIHYGLPGTTPRRECAEHIQSCLYVDAEGECSPCVYCNPPFVQQDEGRRVFGTVRHTTPLKIWDSPEFRRFRTAQASERPDGVCLACPKRFERLV